MDSFFRFLGVIAAIGMPISNIPLMVRVIRRKSSDDISLGWLFGIWGCIVLMFPSSLVSTDIVLRAFGISNLIMFSAVVVVVLKYRNRK